ncbi:MAG: nucleotidyltransferase family protein [Kiritimatiellae bacterium]|nr:nucleotidyltransferase family protein [Kiritimatiellia bacterium]
MKSVLEILADGLSKRNIQALLIGGHALQPYGIVRQTLDVDCLVADHDAGVVGQILVAAGYQERARTDNFARYAHASLYLMDVDVLLVDHVTLQLMLKASRKYCMGSFEWRVPCLVHLVALKLHAVKNAPRREARDFGDIVELLRVNRAEWQTEELKSVCKKYGPKDIYAKLEAALR